MSFVLIHSYFHSFMNVFKHSTIAKYNVCYCRNVNLKIQRSILHITAMMVLSRMKLLAVVVTLTLTLRSTDLGVCASITCYQCSGLSGIGNLSAVLVNCGLPFKNNLTAPLPTVQCDGTCVTQAIYSGWLSPV